MNFVEPGAVCIMSGRLGVAPMGLVGCACAAVIDGLKPCLPQAGPSLLRYHRYAVARVRRTVCRLQDGDRC